MNHPANRRAVAVFLLALVIFGAAILYAVLRVDRVSVTAAQLRGAAYGECHRVQKLRDQVNAANLATYNAFVYAADLTARTNPPAAVPFRRLARRITFIPATNCHQAVEHPLKYRPPDAVPFGAGGHQLSRVPQGPKPSPGGTVTHSASATATAVRTAAVVASAVASRPTPTAITEPPQRPASRPAPRAAPRPRPPAPSRPAPSRPSPTPPAPGPPPRPLGGLVPCIPVLQPVIHTC